MRYVRNQHWQFRKTKCHINPKRKRVKCLLNVKIKIRIAAFMLAAIIVFVMQGIIIGEADNIPNALHGNSKASAGVLSSSHPSAGFSAPFFNSVKRGHSTPLISYVPKIERGVITQTILLGLCAFILCISVLLLLRRINFTLLARKKRLSVLALSIGGNSPPSRRYNMDAHSLMLCLRSEASGYFCALLQG